jgi:hypothetical protein
MRDMPKKYLSSLQPNLKTDVTKMMKDDVENIFKTSTDNNSPAALKLS